jgi:hypothetical protein
MKTLLQSSVIVILLTITLSSCYVMSFDVGKGAKLGVTQSKKNHYLIYGLIPLSTANVKEMSAGASDFSVTIEHSFLDGLLQGLTGGIYTPTSVTVVR